MENPISLPEIQHNGASLGFDRSIIDLSPVEISTHLFYPKMRIHTVSFDEEKELVRYEPLTLYPRLSECGEYLTIHSDDLGKSLSEEHLEDLKEKFEDILTSHWEVFVMGDPNEMDTGALKIRSRLKANYRLVSIN